MKKSIFAYIAAFMLVACNGAKESNTITVNGTLEGVNAGKVYLFQVTNQFYESLAPLDSLNVTDGKFAYSNDSLQTQLFFVTTHSNPFDESGSLLGSYLFLQKGNNDVRLFENDKQKIQAENNSFALQKQYEDFMQEKDRVGNVQLLDSFTQAFYAARAANDQEEMKRIKEESMPYYEEATEKVSEYISQKTAENKTSLFGLYLFYTYGFQNKMFSTSEQVAEVRRFLEPMDEEAKKSDYFDKIEKRLTLIENCSVGHEAPEIWGLDTLDNEVKLSDFRGKYVLVDFWSSGCSWCRKETPNFQKTHDEFKDKNLVILGVSSDYRKKDWVRAIHEDKSYWNQIMMKKADIQNIMNSYVIVGIPQILLVDPQGVILAKDLRGDDIYNAVAEHVK